MAEESKKGAETSSSEPKAAGKRKVFAIRSVTHNAKSYRNEYIGDLTDAQADRLVSLGYAVEGDDATKAERAAAKSAKGGRALPGGATNPDDPEARADVRESTATGKAGPDPSAARGQGSKSTEQQKASAKGDGK
jgi:hypothetical protein